MKETITNIGKVFQYGKAYKKNLIQMILAVISGTIIGIIVPILTAKQILYFTSSSWKQLILISLVILATQCYKNFAAMFFTRRNSQIFTRNTMKNLQLNLGNEILKISQKDIDSNSSGMFIQRIVNDTEKMATFISWGGLEHLRHILANIGALFATFFINKQVFLYYLIVTIILTMLHNKKTTEVGIKSKKFRNQTEKVSSLTGELIRGIRDIRMLNAKDSFMEVLDQNISSQNARRFEMAKVNMTYKYFIDTLTSFFEFGLVILLIFLVRDESLSIAMAIALFNYKSGIMNTVIGHISNYLDEAKEFNISCDRVFSILENKTYSKEKFGNKALSNVNGNFAFKNVTFGYNEKDVLKDISFEIQNGQMIGFVGKSGAGKTTIFNLLCKMYDVNSGEILIENTNINELNEDSIRGNITIINQNPYVFNLSIRDNLKLVKKDLTEEEMINACKAAYLDEFISTLPNKYDTVIGESGVTLSGGQKQRLAIARALVQKTKIILFDEATSALDNESQNKIMKAIENLKKDYTILIIAHRLSTIINCDKILVLDDGKIVDSGTHEQLLANNKAYKALYKTEIIR